MANPGALSLSAGKRIKFLASEIRRVGDRKRLLAGFVVLLRPSAKQGTVSTAE
ncbi:hypothetical protein [Sinorhizobium medicae]|uniref:hypothetical protein n=1 Tax=Sinorhizobium medicae TaxID=110321 RepID=UPI00037DDBA1|nr:hypothetical protein [Sinorhizobium medicae]